MGQAQSEQGAPQRPHGTRRARPHRTTYYLGYKTRGRGLARLKTQQSVSQSVSQPPAPCPTAHSPPPSSPARALHSSYTYSQGGRRRGPAPAGPRSGGAWPGATGWDGGRREGARGRRHPLPPRGRAGPREEPPPSGAACGAQPGRSALPARAAGHGPASKPLSPAETPSATSASPEAACRPRSPPAPTVPGTRSGGGRSSPARRRAPLPPKPEALGRWEVPEKQVPGTFPRWGSRAQGSGSACHCCPGREQVSTGLPPHAQRRK